MSDLRSPSYCSLVFARGLIRRSRGVRSDGRRAPRRTRGRGWTREVKWGATWEVSGFNPHGTGRCPSQAFALHFDGTIGGL
eukprot:746974-Prorocentrum_minimum.AAC.1